MKTKLTYLLLLLALPVEVIQAGAQGTAFTYQGRLNAGSSPATGLFDLTFKLFSVASGGSVVAGPLTNSATGVTNGLFTVTLDFGSVFNGTNYWLEIGVRTNGNGVLITLAPRQAVLPTPYAIFAEGASNVIGVVPSGGLSGSYGSVVNLNNSANQFSGSFTGNGGGLTNLNVTFPGGLTASNFWKLGGNNVAPGQFLGSTNNQPVEIWVNDFRALRLEPSTNGAPNVIGGSAVNFVAPGTIGATIGGGGATNDGYGNVPSNSVSGNFGTVTGGWGNTSSNLADTVGGGEFNTSSGGDATVSGGYENLSSGADATVGGGYKNQSSGDNATVGGGFQNNCSGLFATVGGGVDNKSSGRSATVGGGEDNSSYVDYATVGGGNANGILANYATVAGGQANHIFNSADFSFIGGGVQNLVTNNATYSTIGGGFQNTVRYGASTTIAGGYENFAGYGVTQTGNYSSVGGGYQNCAQGDYSTTPGGYFNWAPGKFSFAAGNRAKAIYDGDFAWADSQPTDFDATGNDQFCIRAQGGMQLDNTTSMFFGNQTRQMLNLYGTGYGIGVQNYVTYFRSGQIFAWFVGGVHSDTSLDPGTGGTMLMELDLNGDLFVHGSVSATQFYPSSDRNLKTGFEPVNAKVVLEKVAALPISRWHFTNEMAVSHIGPMAQDFHSAFDVGMDDKHIGVVDEGGVALAAIQGLNQKLEETQQAAMVKDGEIQSLKQQNDSLAERLNELEATVKLLAAQKVYAHQ
jgi:hypothetical protein